MTVGTRGHGSLSTWMQQDETRLSQKMDFYQIKKMLCIVSFHRPTSLTGVLSSSPSLQLSEDSEGALMLSVSSISEALTMETAVIRPYRSKTA